MDFKSKVTATGYQCGPRAWLNSRGSPIECDPFSCITATNSPNHNYESQYAGETTPMRDVAEISNYPSSADCHPRHQTLKAMGLLKLSVATAAAAVLYLLAKGRIRLPRPK